MADFDEHFRALEKALSKRATPARIERIIDQNPSILDLGRYKLTRSVLHHFLGSMTLRLPPLDVLAVLVRRCPEAVKTKECDMGLGYLPLHLACRRDDATVPFIALLVESYPEALRLKSDFHSLPLHLAAGSDRSQLEVVRFIFEKYPEAIFDRGWEGNTPLHHACRNDHPRREIIELLLSNDPQAMGIQNDKGETPIHSMCRSVVPVELIKSTIQRYPDAVALADNFGNTPLHKACKEGLYEIVQMMTELWPDLSISINKDGQTPWDVNRENGKDAGSAECLEHAATSLVGDLVRDHQRRPSQMVSLIVDRISDILARPLSATSKNVTDVDWNSEEMRKFNRTKVYNDLQELVRRKKFKEMVKGYRRMNESGRKELRKRQPTDKRIFVNVCLSVSDNIDCLYVLVRENSQVCSNAGNDDNLISMILPSSRSRKTMRKANESKLLNQLHDMLANNHCLKG